MDTMDYILYYRSNGKVETVNLGGEKGWLEEHRSRLDQADLIGLEPKKTKRLPAIRVHLKPGRRWIYFSRVFQEINSHRRIRLYCIGWQETVNGKNVKTLNWIYPNGAVEVGEEPLAVHELLNKKR